MRGMKTRSETKRKWEAVRTRDARADGAFVYAVRTTGIYCRPSCPSRRPRPAVVEYFEHPAAAERAGYRACRRCTPQHEQRGRAAVIAACRHIDEHHDERITLAALGGLTGVSPFHLQRLFRRIVGVSPREYQETSRIAHFKKRLSAGQTILHAMLDAGFGATSRLYEKTDRLGMTPARYRKGAAGLEIAFTTLRSALGSVLIAATARGVCAIALGDDAAQLESGLRAEFRAASIRRDATLLRPHARKVKSFLNGSLQALDLPLDIRATAFQRKIWDLLRTVPFGHTTTYGEIARRAGKPEAARAVARAIATNPVALAIPCHRAVRKSGGLAGYRWGIQRKAALLARERVVLKKRRA